MPNGWKKNNFAFGHKIALCGGGSFTFCRCDRCCKSLNRAKANIDVVDTASGGKLASRSAWCIYNTLNAQVPIPPQMKTSPSAIEGEGELIWSDTLRLLYCSRNKFIHFLLAMACLLYHISQWTRDKERNTKMTMKYWELSWFM